MSFDRRDPPDPVKVIESIPVAGEHELDPIEVRLAGIPTPAHLRVFREIGRGGMGRVHAAMDRNLLRQVALKRLDQTLAEKQFYREGFVAEAQITGQLEHPNIVPVHELAVADNGVPYFTMKLVHGEGFHRWLADPMRAPGSPERLERGLEILVKVCDALAYAHHRGVIHRDIKPENIMVASFGQVYLMDWGLARLTRSKPASGASAQMEAPGAVGTGEYMAPEQARGNPLDMTERSDIFGLGAVLYEIVSGRRIYGDERDPERLIEKARAGKIVPLERVISGIAVPKALVGIVERATMVDPNERYATVTELQRDLQEFLRGGLYLPRRTFFPGALIVREGDPGDAAYMILSGTCRAYRTVGDRRELLATMTTGDVFGEMALLLGEARAASVEATTLVTVLVLDKQTLTEGLGANGWTGALVLALAQRFRALELKMRSSGVLRDPA